MTIKLFLEKKYLRSIYLLLIATVVLLAFNKTQYIFFPNQTIDCKSITDSNIRFVFNGEFTCSKQWDQLVVNAVQSAHKNTIQIERTEQTSLHHENVDFHLASESYGGGGLFDIVDSSTQTTIGQSLRAGTEWSGKVRFHVEVSLSDLHPGASIQVDSTKGGIIFTDFSSKKVGFQDPSKPARVKQNFAAESYVVVTILLLLASFLIFLNLGLPPVSSTQTGWFTAAQISFIFFIAVVLFALPYGSAAGWYDRGDDSSYVHWAYNLFYLFDPILSHSDLSSMSLENNHHPWGTGILLGIPLMLLGLKQGLHLGVLHLGLMSVQSMFLAFLAVSFLIASARRFFSMPTSIMIGLMYVFSSSLIKWTFMRNIFSHTSEAFTLTALQYFCISYFFSENAKNKVLKFFFILLFLCLAIQVRRENILLALFPAFFACTDKLDPLGKRGLKLLSVIFTVLVAQGILLGTNLLSKNAPFWYFPASSAIETKELLSTILQNAQRVLLNFSSGFLGLWNMPVLIGCCAIFSRKIIWRVKIPALLTVCATLLMCLIHAAPNGDEWQNRYLLKILPFICLGFGFLLESAPSQQLKTLLRSIAVFSVVYEIGLYYLQLETGLAFFVHRLSDRALVYPAPPDRFDIFFSLPLFFFLFLFVAFNLISLRTERT